MTKILIISDLHIDKFNGDQSRLDNYLILADDLLQLASDNSISQLYILGDIINKSVTTPEILSTLSRFISKLSTKLSISYILGQHDYSLSNIINDDLSHTYLSLYPITYIGGRQSSIKIEDVLLSFADYSRDKNIIAPKCDIFLSHISYDFIDYDDSNVRLFTIAGDIHKPNDYTKYHHPAYSISPPIQLHPSEPQQGYAMILTIDKSNASVERIKLPIRLTLKSNIDNKSIISTNIKIPDLSSSSDVNELFFNNDNNLKFIHSKIISKINKLPVIKTFKINKLVIDNFKSINHKEIIFNSNNDKIIYISGNNGSGKSTIMEALLLSFIGFGIKLSKYKPVDSHKYPSLQVYFYDDNHQYSIHRDESGVKLLKDNNQIELGKSKNDCQSALESIFPIIQYLPTLFIQTYTHLLDNYNIQSLLSLYLDLKYYDNIISETKYLIKKVNGNIYESNNSKLEIQSKIDLLENQYNIYQDKISKYSNYKDKSIEYYQGRIDKSKQLSEYKNQLESFNNKLSDLLMKSKIDISALPTIDELTNEREILTKNESLRIYKKKLQDKLTILENSDKLATCPNCNSEFSINHILIDDLKSQINQIPNETPTKYTNDQINKCIIQINNQKLINNEIEELNKSISNLNNQINNSDNTLESLEELYDGLTNVKLYKELEEQININRDEFNNLSNQLVSIESEINKSNLQLSLLEKYKSKFDITDMSSIPYTILTSLLSSISNNTIKFITSTTLINGENRFKISAQYNGIDYDLCSQGQKTMIDLTLFRALLTTKPTMPFVMLDETLSTLKSDNYDTAIDIVDNINSDKIIITSHQLDYNHYDSRIDL